MRKKIKREIKSIIQTMAEAHTHAMFLLQNKRNAEANDLLLQCQECAAHIGESIEKSEGMDTKAVSHLETYCDYLFKMSRMIDTKKLNGLKHQLDSCLKQVEYELDGNIPVDRMKIVFMPYKASMWDCMESVWEAADADETCDAYVVPIPYYERNGQGMAEKFCYEGDIFPKEVPITSYEKFSLEIERPDVIYIHNPYDNNNYVTSVYPDYYSAKLKEYTDKLVYIPYYILGSGEMPEAHRCISSYNYIDKIIVQDEEKKKSLLDFVPDEKIEVIGCPKVDRLLKLDRKKKEIIENEIPKEWREKITGKKIILFNVSITGILQNKKYAMDKIRYVLSCFENRDDVVLLWRPHPLVEATLKSMRPDMYEEYMGIKKLFIHKGTGILDETGDAGMAAVVADAYLGEDSSSLVHYFGVLGKPVYYIDWTVAEDTRPNRDYLNFNTYDQKESTIFFVPLDTGLTNQLYQMNLENGKIEKNMTLPGAAKNAWGCYYGIKKIRNKIILVPHNAEDIYIYDVDRKQGIKIVLPEFQENAMMFDEAVEYKEKIFFLPRCYPAIVSIDLQSLEVCSFKECIKTFRQDDTTKQIFFWAYYQKEKYLYLASCNDSQILIFNMEDGNYKIKKIGEYPYGYYRLINDGKYFWLSAYKKNCIVRWDENTGETREYVYPMEQEPSVESTYYSSLLDSGDEIILCYAFSVDIMFINKNTGKYRRCSQIKSELDRLKAESTYDWGGFAFARFLDDENVIMYNGRNSSINIWNIRTNQWKSYPCRLNANELRNIEKKQIENDWLIKNTPFNLSEGMVTIPMFIDYMLVGDVNVFRHVYECYQKSEKDITIGEKIHENIKM